MTIIEEYEDEHIYLCEVFDEGDMENYSNYLLEIIEELDEYNPALRDSAEVDYDNRIEMLDYIKSLTKVIEKLDRKYEFYFMGDL